jgi:hypothetical protein
MLLTSSKPELTALSQQFNMPVYQNTCRHTNPAQKSKACHCDIHAKSWLPAGDHFLPQSIHLATVIILSIFVFIVFFFLKAKCKTT